jgi:hypothetical protein
LHEAVIDIHGKHADLSLGREFSLVNENVEEPLGQPIIRGSNPIRICQVFVSPHFVTANATIRLILLLVSPAPPFHVGKPGTYLVGTDKSHQAKMNGYAYRSSAHSTQMVIRLLVFICCPMAAQHQHYVPQLLLRGVFEP